LLSKIRFYNLIQVTLFALIALSVCPRALLSADSVLTPKIPKKTWKAMALLLYADPRWKGWESHPSWDRLYRDSVEGREAGLESLVFDVWQGLVERDGADRPDFSYFNQAFTITWDSGKSVGLTMSSHLAGPNVADTVRLEMSDRLRNRIAGMVKLRQIFLAFPQEANEEAKERVRSEMRALAKQATPENFAKMAKEHSQDKFSSGGGDMGWIQRGTLESARDEALNRLRVGQITKPVETSRGLYLLQLDEVDKSRPDLAFVSETGARNPHYSIWALPYVEDILVDHWIKVRDHFGTFRQGYVERRTRDQEREALSDVRFNRNLVGTGVSEIIIGGTSAGEIRTTAWDEHDRLLGFKAEADYPGRGLLQISSILAQDDLREAMKSKYPSIAALNLAWDRNGSQAFSSWETFSALTTKEEVDAFIAANGIFSQMGRDVFGWLNDSLAKYAKRLLELAILVFHAPGSPYAKVPIAVKFPVAHWHSRFPQLAGGLIAPGDLDESGYPAEWNEADGHGYGWIFTKVIMPLEEQYPASKGLLYPIATGAGKPDCAPGCGTEPLNEPCDNCRQDGRPGRSTALSLTRGFVNLAEKYKRPVAFENALAGDLFTEEGNFIIEKLMESPWVPSITYLREEDVVSPYNRFTRASIKRMRKRYEESLRSGQTHKKDCPSAIAEMAGAAPK
jgi:hypothetical protein